MSRCNFNYLPKMDRILREHDIKSNVPGSNHSNTTTRQSLITVLDYCASISSNREGKLKKKTGNKMKKKLPI